MNFFCTKKHWDEWTRKHSVNEDEVFCLDAHDALIVARMLFTDDSDRQALVFP